MPASDYEASLYRKVLDAITRWFTKIRNAVLGPFGQPDPSAVLSRRPAWNAEVDRLMPELERIAAAGWNYASDQTFVSTSSFIIADMARAENLLRNLPNEVYALLVAELVDGQQAGESVEELRERIDRILTVTGSARWTNRARVIAQTESNRAWNAGVYGSALYYEPPTGKGWLKIWVTNLDGRERPSHHRADGQTVALRDFFMIGTPPFPMLYPGDPRAPADEVINCVPGSARISACGVEKAFRYTYSGPMATLACESGQRLTVSPNHPVLTEGGWVAARQLREGDYLVGTRLHEGESGADPDVHHVPPTAEQVFSTLLLTHTAHRVVGLPMDLHGDGPDGEIEVVLTNRPLAFGLYPEHEQPFKQLLLASADAPTSTQSPQLQLPLAPAGPPGGGMCWSDLRHALVGRHVLPLEGFGLGAVAGGDSGSVEGAREGGAGDGQAVGEGLDGFSPQVVLDKLVSVEWSRFDGHLYTFQTKSGVYVADSIVSHNCRCSIDLRKAT